MFYFMFFTCIWILNVSLVYCDDHDPCDSVNVGLLPHAQECQLYYNCSLPASEFKPWLGKHVMECTYPDLFDAKLLECQEFQSVKCKQRTKYDHACEYRNNMCGPNSKCERCKSDFTCDNTNSYECNLKLYDPLMQIMCTSIMHNNTCLS